jgi:hypothetical protein
VTLERPRAGLAGALASFKTTPGGFVWPTARVP